jgi:hypothetical protein
MKIYGINKICFYCGEIIDCTNDKCFLLAVEKPYTNLYLHRMTCKRIVDELGWIKYLTKEFDRIKTYKESPDRVRKSKIIDEGDDDIADE